MDLLNSSNKTCVDKLKQCNEIRPFSETILKFGENPAWKKIQKMRERIN